MAMAGTFCHHLGWPVMVKMDGKTYFNLALFLPGRQE